ncbi:MAG: tRNA (adenosine(37)-N6)-threonylcarbamoyltransferase complex transferase subunit TsaD [Cyclobacteriaceae bacterium]|nr:tRNA (adenosine(37)-N6)-threonylcarbamoyltransferase complex transferase subunit TsaD [Cyclobacteriaceae bacterium]
MRKPIILAIESSCDETSAAIIINGKIVNNIVATQSVHENYGGVVPELASRAHEKHIVPIIDEAIKNAGITLQMLDAVAFTQGPGLLGALLVGASFAKSLAFSLDIPLIGVNHMQAHILAHFLDVPHPAFPFLCLTVSGGHTQIVKVESATKMEVIGQTLDDAVGEAFDKSAKLMGLTYPGGPLIDRYAAEGNPERFIFSDASIPGFNFSFSGIKTAFMYFLKDNMGKNSNFIEENRADICASLQHSLVRMLLQKLKKASDHTKIREIAIAGGVSANKGLRNELSILAEKKKWNVYVPKLEYCTDNAAMIAMNAHFKYLEKDFCDLSVTPQPRMVI